MELKPCPWCQREPHVSDCGMPENKDGLYAWCLTDGCANQQKVYKMSGWNRRAAPEPEPGDERNRLTQIFLKCARFKIYIDGNKWCATFDDFENLQESPVGFGDDEYEAVVALLEDFE